MAFMPENAPWVFVAFVLAGFLSGLATLTLVAALALGQGRLARWALGFALGLALTYGGALLLASLTSRDHDLVVGERKYFCEVDCHEAYSVVGVRTAKVLGTAPHEAIARGIFYSVKIKVWFDPRTTSPHRGNGPLTPNPHVATIVDEAGRQYPVSVFGQQALEAVEGPLLGFTQPLRPGESYETSRVFDVPSDIMNPRLLITTPEWVTLFLIGHENSFFHARIYFKLAPATAVAGPLSRFSNRKEKRARRNRALTPLSVQA